MSILGWKTIFSFYCQKTFKFTYFVYPLALKITKVPKTKKFSGQRLQIIWAYNSINYPHIPWHVWCPSSCFNKAAEFWESSNFAVLCIKIHILNLKVVFLFYKSYIYLFETLANWINGKIESHSIGNEHNVPHKIIIFE